MDLKIKNFGKIAEADVKLDGITVICGNNNSGKSTVGKALFGFFNSLCEHKYKIRREKVSAMEQFCYRYSNMSKVDPSLDSIEAFVKEHDGEYCFEEVKAFLENNFSLKAPKEAISSLMDKLNASDEDILNLSVFRYFNNLMNSQIKNTKARGAHTCSVTGRFRDGSNTIKFPKYKAVCINNVPLEHCAYYINSPFVLDTLNDHILPRNIMERSTIMAIVMAQHKIDRDSMSDILDSVVNAKELEEVRKLLKNTYEGDTKISNGRYFYNENGVDFDIKNISAGLKAFGLIERMLETGVLKKKDVLILDEPEIHLHSEWQIKYAELIVALQKHFDLTILIVTHSFQFLESLDFFMKKYGISDKGNYYVPEETDKGTVMKSCTDNLRELKQGLKSGMYTLADLQLDEINNGDSDEEDNE